MSSQKKIVLRGDPIRDTKTASAAITPGDWLTETATQVTRHAIGNQNERLIAVEQASSGRDIDDDYAASDTVDYVHLAPGMEVNALVPASAAAITAGARLEPSSTAGKLKLAVRASATVSGQSAAAGDLTFTSRLAGAIGNGIRIVVADAGTASVAVSGTTITVTPATGANTANAVKAQIEADSRANSLVTVAVGGDGTGEPGISAGVNLSGAFGFGDVATALEAVDNSAGVTPARIRCRVL